MSRFLTLIMCVLCLTAHAQIKLSTTTYKGETYTIYPARLPFHTSLYKLYNEIEDYDFEDGVWYESINLDLPYNPFNLPDGKYLMYYQKREILFDDDGLPIYSHEDTTIAAAIFELKANKKNGKAIWINYDTDQRILQEGQYVNDVKSGQWTRYDYRGKTIENYKNGLIHGKVIGYNIDGNVRLKTQYQHGYEQGERIDYHANGAIEYWRLLDSNKVIESKKYDEKGVMVRWFKDYENDRISQHNYDSKGRLTQTKYRPQSNGSYRTIWYNKKGNVTTDVTQKGSTTNTKHQYTRRERQYHRIGRIITGSYQAEAATIYHYNGQLKLTYDLRNGNTHEIPVFDKKGKITKQYNITWTDSMRFTMIQNSFNKNGKRTYTRVNNHMLESPAIMISFDRNGDTSSMLYNNSYLSLIYGDQSGIKLWKKSKEKHAEKWTFNILHTSLKLVRLIEKGRLVADFSIDTFTENGVLLHRWTQKYYDKSGRFEIQHQRTEYLPPRTSNGKYVKYNYAYYEDLAKVGTNDLLHGYDSLDYTMYYDGKPFTGEVDVKHYSGNHKYITKLKTKKVKKIPEYTLKVKTSDGSHYAYQSIDVVKGQVAQLSNYSRTFYYNNNKLTGEPKGRKANYVNGLRHGLYRSGGISCEYYHGLRHGTFLKYGYYSPEAYYSSQIRYRAHYHLDTVHGWYYEYVRPMELTQKVWFEKGVPHGKYWRGNVTSPTAVEANLHHGFLIDTAYYHFSEGGVKVKVFYRLSDKVFFTYSDYSFVDHEIARRYSIDSLGLNARTTEILLNHLKATGEKYITRPKLITFSEYRTGDYTYYYKNGMKASEGRVERRQKVGTWKYWDVNGGLYKIIDYEKHGEYVNPTNKGTLKYWGIITMWHPNGDTLLTGLILSEKDRFNCNQEMKVDIQNVFYLSYYDKNNKSLFRNGTGPITEYHTNSVVRVTGTLKDGKKDGIWKYYTPQGRLEEIGRYDKGLKTGLWVQGDLEAVPYIEDLCIQGQMDSYTFPDVDGVGYLTQKIKLVQSIYTNGIKSYTRTTQLLPLY